MSSKSFILLLLSSIFTVCTFVNPPTFENSFRQCLISQPSGGSLGYCVGVSAFNKLQSLDNEAKFDITDGFTFIKDPHEFREAYNFEDRDPSEFRTIVDSVSSVFSRRSMRWDMSFIYPGLAMQVAPSVGSAGVLEFVLDPHREALNTHSLKEASTGRLLAKQFLVPLLLGFKFNVATILPIIFALLALMAKKALVISKLALIISSALGLGTLLFGQGNNYHPQATYTAGHFNPGFGVHYNRYPEEDLTDAYYRSNNDRFSDQLRLYEVDQNAYEVNEKSKGRNFVWEENENTKKKPHVEPK